MFFIIFLYLLYSKLNQISSLDNDFPIFRLEQEVIKEISLIDINSKTIYIISTNNISGTYTYDIHSPYLLELSHGKSYYSSKIPDLFEANFEKNDMRDGYFYSFSFEVNEDNKYTFLKIFIKDDIDKLKNNNSIKILLVKVYTWKIICFCSLFFLFYLILIIYLFCFKREFLIKFCYFRKGNKLQYYSKIPKIYELNIIEDQTE